MDKQSSLGKFTPMKRTTGHCSCSHHYPRGFDYLIASAPELLEACKAACTTLMLLTVKDETLGVVKQLQQAINHAEGKA